MALSSVSLTYSGAATAPFDLDISVSRSRFFRARFAPGESKVVSSLTLDELQQSSILQTLLAAGTFVLSSVEGDTGSGLAVGPVDLTPATAAASANFGAAAALVGVPFTLRVAFAAGAAGAADDVSIFPSTATLPFAVRLLSVDYDATAIGAAATPTLRLNSATGGGGGTNIGAGSGTLAGAGRVTPLDVSVALAAGSQLYVRRTNRDIAGAVILHLVRE